MIWPWRSPLKLCNAMSSMCCMQSAGEKAGEKLLRDGGMPAAHPNTMPEGSPVSAEILQVLVNKHFSPNSHAHKCVQTVLDSLISMGGDLWPPSPDEAQAP
mmetsp:Transcript_6862/g.15181  ORF Transcript_6862/g.15181 Transcript_6862/m.15181 type:complete len:101 (+) Transcript_6862:567-869(+)